MIFFKAGVRFSIGTRDYAVQPSLFFQLGGLKRQRGVPPPTFGHPSLHPPRRCGERGHGCLRGRALGSSGRGSRRALEACADHEVVTPLSLYHLALVFLRILR